MSHKNKTGFPYKIQRTPFCYVNIRSRLIDGRMQLHFLFVYYQANYWSVDQCLRRRSEGNQCCDILINTNKAAIFTLDKSHVGSIMIERVNGNQNERFL